jgi:hypothetical protein
MPSKEWQQRRLSLSRTFRALMLMVFELCSRFSSVLKEFHWKD